MRSLLREGVSEVAFLEQTYKTITKLAPEVLRSHRCNAHKVELLWRDVLCSSWATEPLSRIATHGLSFLQLYGKLEAAVHMHRKARRAAALASASRRTPQDAHDVPGILSSGRGRYARPGFGSGESTLESCGGASRAGHGDPLAITGCFNCDDPAHTMRHCTQPIHAVTAARPKMDYYATKKAGKSLTSAILHQLCSHLVEMELCGDRAGGSD